ncbi:MAG: Ig-like domain-containing protein [Myxococcota bacterium]
MAQRNVDVLNEGFHNLQIQAVDRRNNLTEYVRTFGVARTRTLRSDAGITCNVSLDGGVDTTAPVVSITSPTSGSAFAGETLAVAAQVTDEGAITLVTAELGTASTTLAGGGNHLGTLQTGARNGLR